MSNKTRNALIVLFIMGCLCTTTITCLFGQVPTPTATPVSTAILVPTPTDTRITATLPIGVTITLEPTGTATLVPTMAAPLTPTPSVVPPTLVPSVPDTVVCDCSGDVYNCGDFANHTQAQTCHNYCVSVGRGDVHKLDRDNDDVACESLP